MKPKIILGIIIIILVLLVGYKKITSYSLTLKANWNISLPKDTQEIYSLKDKSNFHGDGIRYHIFSYEQENAIQEMVDWSSEEQKPIYFSTYEESIDNWLNKINVPKEYYPNYENAQYWYNNQIDNSEIIIIWNQLSHKLYIIESFI